MEGENHSGINYDFPPPPPASGPLQYSYGQHQQEAEQAFHHRQPSAVSSSTSSTSTLEPHFQQQQQQQPPPLQQTSSPPPPHPHIAQQYQGAPNHFPKPSIFSMPPPPAISSPKAAESSDERVPQQLYEEPEPLMTYQPSAAAPTLTTTQAPYNNRLPRSRPTSAASLASTKMDTKQKLASLIDGFSNFDTEIKMGTKQRREKDELKLNELRNCVIKVDKALSAEIKRGLERNKAIQGWAEEQFSELTTSLSSKLEERTKEANDRLENLRNRILRLEEFFALEKDQLLREVEEKGSELSKTLNELQESMDHERRDRLEREGRILKQLGEHEQELTRRLEQEKSSREAKYLEVRRNLDGFLHHRNKAESKFQSHVYQELANLKSELAQEAQARVREDDEIIESLTRYTTKLQQSLKIINASQDY